MNTTLKEAGHTHPGKMTQNRQETMSGKPVVYLNRQTVLKMHSDFEAKLLCDGPTFTAGDACVYRCTFCYVQNGFSLERNIQNTLKTTGLRFQDLVIRRKDAAKILKAQLLDARGKPKYMAPQYRGKVIYASPLVDVAANLKLVEETVELVRLILELTSWDIRLLSKSSFLPRIAEALGDFHRAPGRVIYGVSTGTLDDRLAAAFECGTAKVSKRLESLHQLQDAGHRTFGMICPSLPQEDYNTFAREMAAAVRVDRCEHVWAEVINVRGESFTRTAEALNNAGFFPEAAALATVSGPGSREVWEAYARATFEAHTRTIPPSKLRFMQYVRAETLPWWQAQTHRGAVLLGKSVHR